ncbi:hypothetical protein ACFL0Q_08815 [Thermodesulfobacteriota bacterium]
MDERSASQKEHPFSSIALSRVCRIAAGYEDCNDADYFRKDPAMQITAIT